MRCKVLIAALAATVVLASTSPVAAQTQGQKRAPAGAKTPWGDPDLQGVWTSDSNSTVPFERPDNFAGKAVLDGDELGARDHRRNPAVGGRHNERGPRRLRTKMLVPVHGAGAAALELSAQSQLFEYACHEGNYGLSNILSAARAEEREAARTGKTLNAADTRGEER